MNISLLKIISSVELHIGNERNFEETFTQRSSQSMCLMRVDGFPSRVATGSSCFPGHSSQEIRTGTCILLEARRLKMRIVFVFMV